VAIALERGARLRDGDVLRWDDVSHMAVIVRVDLPDVMIIDFGALLDGPPETLLARSAEVGHALGNQHWPAVVKGTRMYVPVTLARNVMATVVRTHDIEGVGCSFAPGAEVLRQLAPQEAGLLFGGPAGHSHLPAGVASEETR
jgi:urease accessory protein